MEREGMRLVTLSVACSWLQFLLTPVTAASSLA